MKKSIQQRHARPARPAGQRTATSTAVRLAHDRAKVRTDAEVKDTASSVLEKIQPV